MIPEADAQRLIARLERHAGRTRPILIYGLIAILAGFGLITYHANSLRLDAEAKARDLEVKKTELTARIDQAGKLASRHYPAADAPAVLARIRTILAAASETTEALDDAPEAPARVAAAAEHKPDAIAAQAPSAETPAAVATPETPAATAAAAAPPKLIRIFLHIADKEQYGDAKELEWALGSASVEGIRIVVPGIEMVDSADDSLRCLKKADCARAGAVAALVNAKLRGRSLKVHDLSRTYERARNVRPGTYEVWLGPGPIAVAAE